MSFILNSAGDYPGFITTDLNLEHILTIKMHTFYKPELSGHGQTSGTYVDPAATHQRPKVIYFQNIGMQIKETILTLVQNTAATTL